jgi:spore coat protein H
MPRGLLGTVVLGLLLVQPVTSRATQDRGVDNLFTIDSPLQIDLHIPEEGIVALRSSRPSREEMPDRPETQATVVEGGREYSTVTVRVKGFSSFQPIDQRPSLTLHFDKQIPNQTFHGLTKVSLNNSAQDPTRLNEALARDVFAAAGVPVPRATFANVTLNGRSLGLYVVTEGFDTRFLRRFFARTNGTLYEGATLADITTGLEAGAKRNPRSDDAVAELIRAAEERDQQQRYRALARILDLDRFLSMVAVETMLSHSDSYSLNRNNYRLYHDPESGKIVFMPHGMDRILGTHRAGLDLSIVPPRLGLVARALLSTAEGRRRYVDRVAALQREVFRPEALCRRVGELASRTGSASHAAELCGRIGRRASELEFQLADRSALAALVPTPAFDAAGLARIGGWRPAPKLGQPAASVSVARRNGADMLHLRLPASSTGTTLRTRLSLPTGRYRITGQVVVTGDDPASGPTPLPVALVRVNATRFQYERRVLGATGIDVIFQVSSSMSPEDIELTLDVPSGVSDVWIDASALTLTALDRPAP